MKGDLPGCRRSRGRRRTNREVEFVEGFARSLLVGIIPLLVLEALGSKEMVTEQSVSLYSDLSITLNFATLEQWLKRRWVLRSVSAARLPQC